MNDNPGRSRLLPLRLAAPALHVILAATALATTAASTQPPVAASSPASAPIEFAYAMHSRLSARGLRECSGLVASPRHRGVFWAINDSGNPPELFAIDELGRGLGRFAIVGVTNVDWEGIALDDSGRIVIGDFGDNDARRRDCKLIVIDEPPDPRGGERLSPRQVIRFAYPDGPRNAEALFAWQGCYYVIEKKVFHLISGRSELFRIAPPAADKTGEAVIAQSVESFAFSGPVTAADLSPDGRRLLVITYTHAYLFDRSDTVGPFLTAAPRVTPICCELIEAACLMRDGTLDILMAAERGPMFRLPRAWAESGQPFAPGMRLRVGE